MAILYLLGTGTPTPTASQFGTAHVLKIDQDFLMFDCGPAATHKMVKAGLFPTKIGYLFFTHHHFDHNADYPCFLLCRWDQSTGVERTLKIYGPKPTGWITEQLIGEDGAFRDDWKARVGGAVSQSVHVNRGGVLPRPEPSFDVCDIEESKVVTTESWSVIARRVHHVEPWLESVAYRVDSNHGSVVFAGDTEPCQELNELAKGADVLVVNCWDHQENMDKNGEGPGQMGTIGAAETAKEAGVKKLILTHYGKNLAEPESRKKGLVDIAKIFKREVVFGQELETFNLW